MYYIYIISYTLYIYTHNLLSMQKHPGEGRARVDFHLAYATIIHLVQRPFQSTGLWLLWILLTGSPVCVTLFLPSNTRYQLVPFSSTTKVGLCQSVWPGSPATKDSPPHSGPEDFSSRVIGEASRKAVAFLMKRGRSNWNFLLRAVLSIFFFLPGSVSQLPSSGVLF